MTGRAALFVGVASAIIGAAAATAVVLALGPQERTTTVVGAPAPVTGGDATPATAVPALGNRFDPAALYANRSAGVVTIYAEFGADGAAQGSGFIVDPQGRILTNAHVITNVASTPGTVRGATEIFVEFRDGERVPAKIIGWDLFNDVGVIEVDPATHRLQPVPLGSSASLRVGSPVAAIGSPFGKQSSLAVGVISATGRSIDALTSGFAISDAIQIDAPINRGNSGGPLFDARGRVIGINAQIQSTSGTAEGVGFAIPIDTAIRSLRQLLETGKVTYAYVGISTQSLTRGVAEELALPVTRGAIVVSVEDDSPAAASGLRAGDGRRRIDGVDVTTGGDVIVSIAGLPVRGSDDIGRIVAERLRPSQTVTFVVIRDGRRASVPVTLGVRPLRRRS